MDNIVICSMSGGKTSLMLKRYLDACGVKTVPVFMNTGLEDRETYEFIAEAIRRGWLEGLVCLEALVNPEKFVGTSYKIVEFKNLHRGKEIAESVIKKYGVYNMNYPHCNREMKLEPFKKWKADHYPDARVAIGIRSDEADRMSIKAKENNLIYPFIKMGITKNHVKEFWGKQMFNLNLPEHLGNCVNCHKKSNNKLMLAAQDRPEYFELTKELESIDPSRKMFRDNRTAQDILDQSLDPSNKNSGCEESCELFGEFSGF